MDERRRALTVLWRIEDFKSEYFWKIPSKQFEPFLLNNKKCFFTVFFDDKKYTLNFNLDCSSKLDFPVDIEWSLLDTDGISFSKKIIRNVSISLYEETELSCPEELPECGKSSALKQDTLTVRFRAWKSQGEFEDAEHFTLLTRISPISRKISLLWPIKHFSTLQLEQDVTTNVHLFDFDYNLWQDYCLKFSLTGDSLLHSVVTVTCDVIKPFDLDYVSTIKVSVLDRSQNVIPFEEEKKTVKTVTCIFPDLISRRGLLKKKSKYLKGDVLNLFCEVSFSNINFSQMILTHYRGSLNLKTDSDSSSVISISEASSQTPEHGIASESISQERSEFLIVLGEDFMSLYKDQSLSDFELRSGDAFFPVHKTVLSARSSVFRAMFYSGMKETDTNFLNVPDVDVHTLNRMLAFLYSGAVEPLQWEAAIKLYYAADKYQIPSLKKHCSSVMKSGITVSNVSDILTLSDRHQDRELTSFVHDFILRNYDEVMKSDEWESFFENNCNLAGKTMLKLYKTKF